MQKFWAAHVNPYPWDPKTLTMDYRHSVHSGDEMEQNFLCANLNNNGKLNV